MPTLKPCPFCGRPAKLEKISGSYGYTPNAVSAGCDACEIKFQSDTEKWEHGRGAYSIYDQAVAEVADRWNTRHPGRKIDDEGKYPRFSRKDLADEMFDLIEEHLRAHYENDFLKQASLRGGMMRVVKGVRGLDAEIPKGGTS